MCIGPHACGCLCVEVIGQPVVCVSSSPVLALQMRVTMSCYGDSSAVLFHMGSGGLNSGPHVCTTSSLPTELSLYPASTLSLRLLVISEYIFNQGGKIILCKYKSSNIYP